VIRKHEWTKAMTNPYANTGKPTRVRFRTELLFIPLGRGMEAEHSLEIHLSTEQVPQTSNSLTEVDVHFVHNLVHGERASSCTCKEH
jgi:hypothetical protein